jgi:GH35 family endo-1,4-beta-xylanase
MSSTKTIDKQQSINQSKEYSKEYNSIRKEAESKWPAWKVSTHNVNFATSAHAKKVVGK